MKLSLCMVAGALVWSASAWALLPKDYVAKSAQEKRVILMKQVVADPYVQLPALLTPALDFTNMLCPFSLLSPAFDHESDERKEVGRKILHGSGSTAAVVFQSNGQHDFTGLFAAEKVLGLLRISSADGEMTFGLALKLLIDGKASLNVHMMRSLTAQTTINVFEHDASSEIPGAVGFRQKLANFVFGRVEKPTTHRPVAPFFAVETNGMRVTQPVAPKDDILTLSPTEAARAAFDKNAKDFREGLKTLVPGTELYQVSVQVRGQKVVLGTIILDSEFVASPYQDTVLNFQHIRNPH